MADEQGKPLSTDLIPSPPAHAATGAEKPKACVACGHHPGGIGMGIACLEREVVRLRRLLRDVPGMTSELGTLRAGVARMKAMGGATAAALDLLDTLAATARAPGGPT